MRFPGTLATIHGVDSLVPVLLAFHKPYGVLSQFTPDGSPHRTLAEFRFPAAVYPLGRLDADSEGLLLLSDEGGLNSRLLDPVEAHPRTYWVQVERIPTDDALRRLSTGVEVQGRRTRPCRVSRLEPPTSMAPRVPPIRFRKNVPDCWLALELCEGRNRQVRRMTAAIGHPTLRLVRVKIGGLELGTLAPGQWRELGPNERQWVFERPESSATGVRRDPREGRESGSVPGRTKPRSSATSFPPRWAGPAGSGVGRRR